MNFNKSVDDALDVLLLPGRMQEKVDGAGAQALGYGADDTFVVDALGVILLGAGARRSRVFPSTRASSLLLPKRRAFPAAITMQPIFMGISPLSYRSFQVPGDSITRMGISSRIHSLCVKIDY